jgi:hypothetical protein
MMRLARALRRVVKDEGSVQSLSQADLEVTKDDRSDCSGKTKVCTVTGGCANELVSHVILSNKKHTTSERH